MWSNWNSKTERHSVHFTLELHFVLMYLFIFLLCFFIRKFIVLNIFTRDVFVSRHTRPTFNAVLLFRTKLSDNFVVHWMESSRNYVSETNRYETSETNGCLTAFRYSWEKWKKKQSILCVLDLKIWNAIYK